MRKITNKALTKVNVQCPWIMCSFAFMVLKGFTYKNYVLYPDLSDTTVHLNLESDY